jgi:NAD(P)-dependent dehydrogenase (short-subunit alcohol dehydrogenase family)
MAAEPLFKSRGEILLEPDGIIRRMMGMKPLQTEIRGAGNGASRRKDIVINYRSGAEQAEATHVMAKAARSNGTGRDLVVQADASNEDQVKQMFATTIEAFGKLDILVNNAGIQKPMKVRTLPDRRYLRAAG